MLLKITEKCDMGCKHCLSSCTENGKHMDIETLKSAVKWADIQDVTCIIVSGGEPFLHPDIEKILEYIDNMNFKKVTVTTNGEWFLQNKSKAEEILNRFNKIDFQVTNVHYFYTRKVNLNDPLFKRENVYCYPYLQRIYPQGRALSLPNIEELSANVKCANCTNFILTLLQLMGKNDTVSLSDVISTYERLGKYCSPQIKINGDISIGESDLCGSVGQIYDSDEIIINNILNNPCEKCKDILRKYHKIFVDKSDFKFLLENLNIDMKSYIENLKSKFYKIDFK